MIACGKFNKKRGDESDLKTKNKTRFSKIKCFKCAKFGHSASQCIVTKKKQGGVP